MTQVPTLRGLRARWWQRARAAVEHWAAPWGLVILVSGGLLEAFLGLVGAGQSWALAPLVGLLAGTAVTLPSVLHEAGTYPTETDFARLQQVRLAISKLSEPPAKAGPPAQRP